MDETVDVTHTFTRTHKQNKSGASYKCDTSSLQSELKRRSDHRIVQMPAHARVCVCAYASACVCHCSF